MAPTLNSQPLCLEILAPDCRGRLEPRGPRFPAPDVDENPTPVPKRNRGCLLHTAPAGVLPDRVTKRRIAHQ